MERLLDEVSGYAGTMEIRRGDVSQTESRARPLVVQMPNPGRSTDESGIEPVLREIHHLLAGMSESRKRGGLPVPPRDFLNRVAFMLGLAHDSWEHIRGPGDEWVPPAASYVDGDIVLEWFGHAYGLSVYFERHEEEIAFVRHPGRGPNGCDEGRIRTPGELATLIRWYTEHHRGQAHGHDTA